MHMAVPHKAVRAQISELSFNRHFHSIRRRSIQRAKVLKKRFVEKTSDRVSLKFTKNDELILIQASKSFGEFQRRLAQNLCLGWDSLRRVISY